MTRTKELRALRKFIGFVLLIVNTVLSVLGFLAVYGIGNFMHYNTNYNFSPVSSLENNTNILDNTTAPKFLYVGYFTFNNTSLFDFNNFVVSFEFDLKNSSGVYNVMNYSGNFGSIPAGKMHIFPLNFTNNPPASNLTLGPDVLDRKLFPENMSVSNSSYIEFRGLYVFDMFDFDLKVTALSTLITSFL
ncbi:MAG TPA: hypothetical protein VKM55_22045 [Candidatus Lokiarchaeia archaeon]|nr:hypothetical protein [Candidatus Lokiarchaeia archaeon]